jgi:regulator of protease activity HflC (stomatin/prohibitin superfamily)
MSSKESYAEKRSAFIQYAEDQISHGVYQTTTQEVEMTDPLSGAKKTVTVVKLVAAEGGKGYARQESSALEEFGIRVYNFSLNDIKYSEDVEKQIQQQQQAIANVQTAMAQAKKAEQDAITIAKQGEASAAKAKWAQETEKATAVTKAEQEKEVAVKAGEQERDVAKLAKEAAQFTKEKEILLGEGEAAHKKLVMAADGALQAKLAAWVEVNKFYAEKFGQQPLVPEVQIGGGVGPGTGGQTAANNLIDLLQVKTARDLALDLRNAKQK